MKRFFSYAAISLPLFACIPQNTEPFPLPSVTGGVITDDIIASDFNNDGVTDLLIPSDGRASVLLQQNGQFTASSLGFLAGHLVAADFDGDNDNDILSFEETQGGLFPAPAQLVVAVNRGDGTFDAQAPQAIPELESIFYSKVQAADLDGDLDLDFVLTQSFGSKFFILRHLSNGSFFLTELEVDGDVLIGDMDQDGDQDLVAGRFKQLQLLLNQGNGAFAPTDIDFEAQDFDQFLLADIDADLDLDIALVTRDSDRIFIEQRSFFGLENNGQGAFTPREKQKIDGPGGLTRMVLQDVNGDGLPEVAFAFSNIPFPEALFQGTASSEVLLFKNQGDFRFRRDGLFEVEVEPFEDGIRDLFLEDVTGDGLRDILAVTTFAQFSIVDGL